LTIKFTQHRAASPQPFSSQQNHYRTEQTSRRHRLIAPGYCEPETPAELGTHKIYRLVDFSESQNCFRDSAQSIQLSNIVYGRLRVRPAWAG